MWIAFWAIVIVVFVAGFVFRQGRGRRRREAQPRNPR